MEDEEELDQAQWKVPGDPWEEQWENDVAQAAEAVGTPIPTPFYWENQPMDMCSALFIRWMCAKLRAIDYGPESAWVTGARVHESLCDC